MRFKVVVEGILPKAIHLGPPSWFSAFSLPKRDRYIQGFFATRYIDADSANDAIIRIGQLIQHELLQKSMLASHNASDLVCNIELIQTIDDKEDSPQLEGFTFYERD